MGSCQICGTQLNKGAVFCKNCGTDLNNKNSNFSSNNSIMNTIFGKFNNSINLIGVYSGLAISLLALIIAPIFYGLFVASGALGLIGLLYLVALTMMLVGGFSTSLLCCQTYSEGLANGGFLGLVALINLGFLIGALWFSAVMVISQIASAFSGFDSSISSDPSFMPDTSSSLSPAAPDFPIVEIVLLPFLMILFGMLGGWTGVFIKKLIKNLKRGNKI